METNTLLLILWEICGVTCSIGNPHQGTLLQITISMGIIW
jgi:hypothetical protein